MQPTPGATRRFATEAPPTPPMPDKKGSSTAVIVGALIAAGAGGGYYYFSQSSKQEDVALKARELDHAARVQANNKIDEGKEKYDEAKVSCFTC